MVYLRGEVSLRSVFGAIGHISIHNLYGPGLDHYFKYSRLFGKKSEDLLVREEVVGSDSLFYLSVLFEDGSSIPVCRASTDPKKEKVSLSGIAFYMDSTHRSILWDCPYPHTSSLVANRLLANFWKFLAVCRIFSIEGIFSDEVRPMEIPLSFGFHDTDYEFFGKRKSLAESLRERFVESFSEMTYYMYKNEPRGFADEVTYMADNMAIAVVWKESGELVEVRNYETKCSYCRKFDAPEGDEFPFFSRFWG